ncbi:hypothetical protein AJ80_06421 [Polytolypa hystricis UAMH7299]|uniref:Decapping nuclease n=1 Tax=Polytolypa hystricis (strain UAMH7299) TaxID=1447883 RepID=A0A2B7XW46_POLH7|nr:hypothetical protein AJ80_06421 [Polytolypa hystricis UAMH7299]
MESQVFSTQPVARFAGSNAAIRRPKEIAYFSYDNQHQFRLDESSLRYYYPPRVPVDLSRGFDTFEQLDDAGDEHLDALLDTIIALEKSTGKKCEADIVTWRGMMTKIMTAPFDNWNGFEMNATYFQGSIFIEEEKEYKLAQKRLQHGQRSAPGAPSQDMMAFWGYKFETLSLLEVPWDAASRDDIESREEKVVNNKAQYCSVVKTGIGGNRLVIGGEVDAVWDCKPDKNDDPINWVELKTSAEIHSARDALKYERKLLKFWAQSFLLGVPKIVVGFRDQHGIVHRLEELQTADIPKIVTRGSRCWDGNICINFTSEFLGFLKSVINHEGVWRIRKREKSSDIEVFKIEESGYGSILSTSFVEWRSQN